MAEAGQITIELRAKIDRFERELSQAKAQLQTLGPAGEQAGLKASAGLSAISVGAAIGTAAVIATVTAIKTVGHEISGLAQIERSSQALGISAQALQRLSFAAKVSGLDVRGFEQDLERFERRLVQGQQATSQTGKLLRELGVTARDPQRALLQLADAFKALPQGQTKEAITQFLFGSRERAIETISFLNQGSAGITKIGESARTAFNTQDALAFQQNLFAIEANFHGIAQALIDPLLPRLRELSEEFLHFAQAPSIKKVIEIGLTISPVGRLATVASKLIEAGGTLNLKKLAQSVAAGEVPGLAPQAATTPPQAPPGGGAAPRGRPPKAPPPELTKEQAAAVLTPAAQATTTSDADAAKIKRLNDIISGEDQKASQRRVNQLEAEAAVRRQIFDNAKASGSTLLELETKLTAAQQAEVAAIAAKKDEGGKQEQIQAKRLKDEQEFIDLVRSEVNPRRLIDLDAAITRSQNLTDDANARLQIAQQEGASQSTLLQIAQQLDDAERSGLEARAASLREQIAQADALKQDTAQLQAQLEGINFELGRGPQHVRALNDAFLNLNETISQTIQGIALGTGSLGNALKRIGDTITARVIDQSVKSLLDKLGVAGAQASQGGGFFGQAFGKVTGFLGELGIGGGAAQVTPTTPATGAASAGDIGRAIVDAERVAVQSLPPSQQAAVAQQTFVTAGGIPTGAEQMAALGEPAAVGAAAQGGTGAAGAGAAGAAGIAALVVVAAQVAAGIVEGIHAVGDLKTIKQQFQTFKPITQANLEDAFFKQIPYLNIVSPIFKGNAQAARISLDVTTLGTGELLKVLFQAPTIEHQIGQSLSKLFTEAGIPKATQFQTTVLGRDLPRLERTTPALAAQIKAGSAGPLALTGQTQAIFQALAGGDARQATEGANTFINSARILGLTAKQTRDYLLQLAAANKIDLTNSLAEANRQFIEGVGTQQDYQRTVTSLLDLFGDELPAAVDRTAIALHNLEQTTTGKGLLNVKDFTDELTRATEAIGGGITAALDAVLQGNTGADAGAALSKQFSDSFIKALETDILKAPIAKVLTKAQIDLSNAADALVRGDQAAFGKFKAQFLQDFAQGKQQVVQLVSQIGPGAASLIDILDMGAHPGIANQTNIGAAAPQAAPSLVQAPTPQALMATAAEPVPVAVISDATLSPRSATEPQPVKLVGDSPLAPRALNADLIGAINKLTATLQGLGSFDTGGTIPGTPGTPQVILAHGGEFVVPQPAARALGLHTPAQATRVLQAATPEDERKQATIEPRGALPQFQQGGVVQGPLGTAQTIIVHGGEAIAPAGYVSVTEGRATFNQLPAPAARPTLSAPQRIAQLGISKPHLAAAYSRVETSATPTPVAAPPPTISQSKVTLVQGPQTAPQVVVAHAGDTVIPAPQVQVALARDGAVAVPSGASRTESRQAERAAAQGVPGGSRTSTSQTVLNSRELDRLTSATTATTSSHTATSSAEHLVLLPVLQQSHTIERAGAIVPPATMPVRPPVATGRASGAGSLASTLLPASLAHPTSIAMLPLVSAGAQTSISANYVYNGVRQLPRPRQASVTSISIATHRDGVRQLPPPRQASVTSISIATHRAGDVGAIYGAKRLGDTTIRHGDVTNLAPQGTTVVSVLRGRGEADGPGWSRGLTPPGPVLGASPASLAIYLGQPTTRQPPAHPSAPAPPPWPGALGSTSATTIHALTLLERVGATIQDSGRLDPKMLASRAAYVPLEVPSFATGGTVPGPVGTPQLIVAHGGEAVGPSFDMQAFATVMQRALSSALPASARGGGDLTVKVLLDGRDIAFSLEQVDRYQRFGQKLPRQVGNG